MAKTKDKNELEHLRGRIRELEKENKLLKRQLKQQARSLEKTSHIKDDEQDSDEIIKDSEDTVPRLLTKDCDNCGRGKVVQTMEIMGKIYGRCSVCDTPDRIK